MVLGQEVEALDGSHYHQLKPMAHNRKVIIGALLVLLVGLGALCAAIYLRHSRSLASEQYHRMIQHLERGFETNGGVRGSNGSWSFPQSKEK